MVMTRRKIARKCTSGLFKLRLEAISYQLHIPPAAAGRGSIPVRNASEPAR